MDTVHSIYGNSPKIQSSYGSFLDEANNIPHAQAQNPFDGPELVFTLICPDAGLILISSLRNQTLYQSQRRLMSG